MPKGIVGTLEAKVKTQKIQQAKLAR